MGGQGPCHATHTCLQENMGWGAVQCFGHFRPDLQIPLHHEIALGHLTRPCAIGQKRAFPRRGCSLGGLHAFLIGCPCTARLRPLRAQTIGKSLRDSVRQIDYGTRAKDPRACRNRQTMIARTCGDKRAACQGRAVVSGPIFHGCARSAGDDIGRAQGFEASKPHTRALIFNEKRGCACRFGQIIAHQKGRGRISGALFQ